MLRKGSPVGLRVISRNDMVGFASNMVAVLFQKAAWHGGGIWCCDFTDMDWLA